MANSWSIRGNSSLIAFFHRCSGEQARSVFKSLSDFAFQIFFGGRPRLRIRSKNFLEAVRGSEHVPKFFWRPSEAPGTFQIFFGGCPRLRARSKIFLEPVRGSRHVPKFFWSLFTQAEGVRRLKGSTCYSYSQDFCSTEFRRKGGRSRPPWRKRRHPVLSTSNGSENRALVY